MKTPDKSDFSFKLGRYLNQKGWNQSDLAREAARFLPKGEEFRRDNVHVYLKKGVVPRPKQLNAIAAALGVKPEDLLPGVRHAASPAPYSMQAVPGEPGYAYLQVDAKIPASVAASVIKLLAETR